MYITHIHIHIYICTRQLQLRAQHVYAHMHIYFIRDIIYTIGAGPGLVARVLWLYCMRLASSGVGVGGVRRVRLALLLNKLLLLYVGSGCVGVLWIFWVLDAASIIRCRGGAWGAVRRLAAPVPVAHPQHPITDYAIAREASVGWPGLHGTW